MWTSLSDINLYEGVLAKRQAEGAVLSQTDVNFDRICRTCLREAPDRDNMLKDFEIGAMNFNFDGRVLRVIDMFVQSIGLEVKELDQLPQQICNNCIQNISGAYFFRLQCHKADNLLHRLLVALNPDPIDQIEKSTTDYTQDEEQRNSDDNIHIMPVELAPENYDPYSEKELSVEFDGVQYKIDSETFQIEELSESSETTPLSNKDEKEDEDIVESDSQLQQIKIEIMNTGEQINQVSTTESRTRGKCVKRKRKTVAVTSGDNFQCEVCNAKFTKYQSLKRHSKIHLADQKTKVCNFCGKGFSRADDLTRHIRTHTGEKPYPCTICPKRYKQTSELKEHMLTHTNDKMYTCTICDKVIKTRNGYYVHKKTHLGLKNHICEMCGNSYVTSGELNSHIRHIHEKKKPFHCNIENCNRSFGTKSSLKVHERAHRGERPFQCSICGKRLATKSSLSHHLQIHKGSSKTKLSVKEDTTKQQETKTNLIEHRSDALFECTLCGKCFVNLDDFEEHQNLEGCEEFYEHEEIEEDEYVGEEEMFGVEIVTP